MKKFAMLLAALTLLGWGAARAQVYFYDDFQNAGVNNFALADLSGENWTLINDNNSPVAVSPNLSGFDKAWKIYRDEDGAQCAASPSYFTPSGTADRWMITRAIDLTQAASPALLFRAKAFDNENRDGFKVMLSESGNAKDDFTVELKSESRARDSWVNHSIDLGAYKGKTVYIAFVQNSNDKFILGIDDVFVGENSGTAAVAAGIACSRVEITENLPYEVEVEAEAFNTGSEKITGFKICYRIDGGQWQSLSSGSVSIEAGKSDDFEVELNVAGAGMHTIELYLDEINGKAGVKSEITRTTVQVALKNQLPCKTAVFELFSSGTCHNCEPWNRFLHPVFEELHANTVGMNSNLVIAKYQVNIPAQGDPMVTDETLARSNYYNVIGAPSFYFGGKRYTPSPENYATDIPKLVEDCRNTPVSLGINANLERTDNTFTLKVKTTTYLPDNNAYRMMVCFVEDSVHLANPQLNGEQNFYYIVRKMMPSASGADFVPAEVGEAVEQEFSYTFDMTAPKIFNDALLNAVVYIQNTMTNEIVAARYAKVGNVDDAANERGDRCSRGRNALGELKIYPNPVRGLGSAYLCLETTAAQNVTVRVYNMAGAEMGSVAWKVEAGENVLDLKACLGTGASSRGNLKAGTYLVALSNERGMIVKKLVVR